MRRQNLLVAVCAALLWSGFAAAQTAPAGNPANPAANPANPANPTVSRNRVRVAEAQVQGNRRDCTQLRGLKNRSASVATPRATIYRPA